MIPFLKDRHEGAMSGPVEVIERKSDEPDEFGMLDAVAEDIIHAVHTKDKKVLKEALEALIGHILDLDAGEAHEEY